MKTKFIIFFFLIPSIYIKAQIEKGTLFPSASLNVYGQKNTTQDSVKNANSNGYLRSGINLYAGKFIKDNLLMVIGIGYNYQKNSNEQQKKTR